MPAPVDVRTEDFLLDRVQTEIVRERRRLVFLVGSALSNGPYDANGWVGVPGTSEMVDEIERRCQDENLDGHPNSYRDRLQQLDACEGPGAVNQFMTEMVLRAVDGSYRPYPTAKRGELRTLEDKPWAWRWPVGMDAFGELLARFPNRCPIVLTTNFDPLIEMAVRAHGGRAATHTVERDARLEDLHLDETCTQVVHLHGHWCRPDTFYDPAELASERIDLQASLRQLMESSLVVVLGHGTPDEILLDALGDALHAPGASRAEVFWCFHSAPQQISQVHEDLLESLPKNFGRISYFGGVDVHRFFPRLNRALSRQPGLPLPDAKIRWAGRQETSNLVLNVLDQQPSQPVEVLCLPGFGRRRFAKALGIRLRLAGYRVAALDASTFAATPADLVQAAADQLDCGPLVESRLHRHSALPTIDDVAGALELLGSAVLLVEHADALAAEGHAFTRAFFDQLNALVAAGRLRWVSMSDRRLSERFQYRGLTSNFFTKFILLRLPGWTEAEAQGRLRTLGVPEASWPWVLEESGGVPMAVERLGQQHELGRPQAAVAFDAWFEAVFQAWARSGFDYSDCRIRPFMAWERFGLR